MKKLISFCVMCLLALTMNAQRCAVLEFRAGAGISQADVDGISAIFITYFRPAGYTMVERTQIDKAIDEQGFQRSKMTESQMVRIGQILNVSKIVVGDVNVVMGQYNVDARVINVESGTIAATEGAAFSSSSFRATMQSLAQKLASKIAITTEGTVQPYAGAQQQRTEPYVIYGYLKVFPTDLGYFDALPVQIIKHINKNLSHGYGSWRLPTNEELSLLKANNVLGSGYYMTKENMKGIVRLVTDKEKTPVGYVDLGLPSGTLWKIQNEARSYYTYDEAISRFGNQLPSKTQWEELNVCQWSWTGNGCNVEGPSGGVLFLPANGWYYWDEEKAYQVGGVGYYWSSTLKDSERVYKIIFSERNSGLGISDSDRNFGGFSVRLVR